MTDYVGEAASDEGRVTFTDDGHFALTVDPAAPPRERAAPNGSASPASVRSPASRVTVASLLRNVEFRVLLVTQFLSIAGDQMARVALSVLVFQRTDSALQSAIVYALTYVPAVIGVPLMSGFADRTPRRTVLVACDLIRVPLVAVLAIPSLPLPVAMIVVAVAGLFEAPFDAARGALMPDVLHGDRYTKGYALSQMSQQAAQVGGFGLAGVLLVAVSPSTLLLVDAASFLGSALLLSRGLAYRPAPVRTDGEEGKTWWQHIGGDAQLAVREVFRSPLVRPLALMAWTSCTFVIAFEALGAPLARASHAPTWTVGVFLATVPLGTVLGALFASRVPEAGRERVMRVLAATALLPLCFGLLRPPPIGLVVIGLLAGFGMAFHVLAVTLLVSRIRHDVRGRVIGFVGSGLFVVQGVGILLAGAVASVTDARVALGWLGVAGSICMAAILADGRRTASAAAGAQPAETADHMA